MGYARLDIIDIINRYPLDDVPEKVRARYDKLVKGGYMTKHEYDEVICMAENYIKAVRCVNVFKVDVKYWVSKGVNRILYKVIVNINGEVYSSEIDDIPDIRINAFESYVLKVKQLVIKAGYIVFAETINLETFTYVVDKPRYTMRITKIARKKDL